MKKILIIDNNKNQSIGSIYKALSYRSDCQLHLLNNEALLRDDLFLGKFNLSIINTLKSEYIDNLTIRKIPSIVMVGNKERHLITFVKHAHGIIKKERPEELIPAIEAIENGGCYLSSELKNLFFHMWDAPEPTSFTENFNDIPTLLTEMELRVVEELINDKTNQQIADTLYLSKRTVEYYIASCIQKLEVNSRVGLAVKITKANFKTLPNRFSRLEENHQISM